ncbi:galactose-1-phosphate uridylyltransferase, partial [Candidatus Woesearchaeota archaeon CG10_big_fil_rev_8_21_14_0_10_47_5]
EGERLIFKDDFAVAFCPYASRFNYEAWLFPKRHTNQLEGCDDNELRSMASALKRVLTRLREIDAPYNFYLHYHDDPDFHFHIEVCPRISKLGGLELGAGIFINSVSPEEAAGFYRQKLAFRASF